MASHPHHTHPIHSGQFVQFHDGEGHNYPFLVGHVSDGKVTGFVFCTDELGSGSGNPAGLERGLNFREGIGEGDEHAAVSWGRLPT